MSRLRTFRVWLLCLPLAAVVCAGVYVASSAGAAQLPAANWRGKVDPGVLTKAAAGPTEFFVYLSRQADLSGAAALKTKEEKGRHVYEQLTATARATQPSVTRALALLGVEYKTFWVTNAVWVRGNAAVVEALAARPDVARIFPSGTGRLTLPPQEADAPVGSLDAVSESSSASFADPNPEPNLTKVGADAVWALGVEGQGVVVAGADTGVFWEHAALKRQYRGWNGSAASHSYNWHDAVKNPNTACQGSTTAPCDDDEFLGGGHGTHTVGTVLGDDGGANRIGMAPRAKWIACRNMNYGVGAVPTYLECMEWFIAPTDTNNQNPDPSKAPHVINNSWGCVEGCAQPLLQDPLRASRAAGIFYVVSAGNDGDVCNTLQFPLARYSESFTVGATSHVTDLIASFSSRGSVLGDPTAPLGLMKPNISAPGVGIRSALRDGGYGSLSGTSMAGPHVAGLAALLISANPRLAGRLDRMEDIIEQTAVRKTSTEGCGGDAATAAPNNTYGHGRIDALAAVLDALPPDGANDTASTSERTPVVVKVLDNDTDPDGDALSVGALGTPAHGTVINNGDGTVTYRPHEGFSGTDSFAYEVCAPEGCDVASDLASVVVNVAGLPINYALAGLGSLASASSVHTSNFPAAAVNDGDRRGAGWGASGGWNDATRDLWPDHVAVNFAGPPKSVFEVRVYTLQNDFTSPVEPDASTDASLYGILDFEVQALDPSTGQWATVPGGVVTGNTKAMRVVGLQRPVMTAAVRLLVNRGREHFSRVIELEAFGAPGQ